jgi:hypothetical protein
MESRRCAEHGLSFLPGFWAMIFSAGAAGGELSLMWDADLASVLGIQMGSPGMQIRG